MRRFFVSLVATLMLFLIFTPFVAYANHEPRHSGNSCQPTQNILGVPTWYKYLPAEEDGTGRCTPVLEDINASLPIGIAVLEGALRLAGLVAVAMIFVSAFRYITSQGSPDNATAARKTAINALIGLVIVIISTAVVVFLGNRLG